MNITGAVLNDGRNENELLDCSMESSGADSSKSTGGGGESTWMRVWRRVE